MVDSIPGGTHLSPDPITHGRNVTERLIAAIVGFVGGGFASLVVPGLIVTVFELDFQNVWQGALVGGLVCCVLGFCFPRLGSLLAEFVG